MLLRVLTAVSSRLPNIWCGGRRRTRGTYSGSHSGFNPCANRAASRQTDQSEQGVSDKRKTGHQPDKRDDFGEIRVNLNWHRGGGAPAKGFLQGIFNSNKGIDLDLGAFVALNDGSRGVIQALGNNFGSYHSEPYVQLQGDDRTGDVSDGEWMHINGREWKHVKEVLIFAFIYEGVPSWGSTDGIVTINVPGQAPIETQMNEGNDRKICVRLLVW